MTLRSVFHSSAFIVSFLFFMVLVILFSFMWSWQSFTLLKVWTVNQNLKIWSNYVRVSDIDSPIIWTVLAQVKIGQWSYFGDNSYASSMRLRNQTEALVEIDILKALREATDPQQMLDMHLSQLTQAGEDIEKNRTSLLEIAEQKNIDSQECYRKKIEWDTLFFAWIQQDDPEEAQLGLDQSLEFWPCYITNRIEANAYRYMAERVTAFYTLISKRNLTLSNNAEMLINSYPLLHWSIAEQLVDLKQQLYLVNSTDFSQFDEYFSLQVPQLDTLPSLQNIWFQENDLNIPTYIEPVQKLWDA